MTNEQAAGTQQLVLEISQRLRRGDATTRDPKLVQQLVHIPATFLHLASTAVSARFGIRTLRKNVLSSISLQISKDSPFPLVIDICHTVHAVAS